MVLRTGFPWRAYKRLGGATDFSEPDVGPLEIKSISAKHHKLILYNEPDMLSPFVRLHVYGRDVTFMGWAFGFEVWDERYWDDSLPVPAYARKQLHGLESLLNWCVSHGLQPAPVDMPVFAEGWEPCDDKCVG